MKYERVIAATLAGYAVYAIPTQYTTSSIYTNIFLLLGIAYAVMIGAASLMDSVIIDTLEDKLKRKRN